MFSLEDVQKSESLVNGINVHKLKPGTIVFVVTQNSLYKIVKGSKDMYNVMIQGGKKFKELVEANFTGSTFGGSIMKLGWIGHNMYIEVYAIPYKRMYKTTPVRAARIVGDGWEYDMEWEEGDQLPIPTLANNEWSPEID